MAKPAIQASAPDAEMVSLPLAPPPADPPQGPPPLDWNTDMAACPRDGRLVLLAVAPDASDGIRAVWYQALGTARPWTSPRRGWMEAAPRRWLTEEPVGWLIPRPN